MEPNFKESIYDDHRENHIHSNLNTPLDFRTSCLLILPSLLLWSRDGVLPKNNKHFVMSIASFGCGVKLLIFKNLLPFWLHKQWRCFWNINWWLKERLEKRVGSDQLTRTPKTNTIKILLQCSNALGFST